MMKENPIPQDMMNEMKGWAKVSDAITNSSKAKKKLLGKETVPNQSKETLSKKNRETIWNEILFESKLRGLCASAYKSNTNIKKSITDKNILEDNLFGKEAVRSEYAYENTSAKEMCALGKDDKLIQNIKDTIDTSKLKKYESKTLCATWLYGHLVHNNEMNAEMVSNVIKNSLKKEVPSFVKKGTEEARQLKSNKEMLSIN